MILSFRYLLVLLLVFLLSFPVLSDDSRDTSEASAEIQSPVSSKIKALLEPWADDNAPGVAVAIMSEGKTVFSHGAGSANLEHSALINKKTKFYTASIAKQVTAFAALTLVSEDKLSLDDDIRLYLPELERSSEIVEIKHLLQHSSGFREVGTLAALAGWLDDDVRTQEQLFELVRRQTGGNFAPGERIEYSNTGYLLLAQIVSRVVERPFSDYVRERFFAPLGMTNTLYHNDRTQVVTGRAESYAPTTREFVKINLLSESVGPTGLITTAEDLLKWAKHLNQHTLGEPLAHDLMAARSSAKNGEGAVFANGQESRPYRGMNTWSHGGRYAGFRSYLIRIPEHDFAISILSNRADFDTAELAFKLIDIYFADQKKALEPSWNPATLSETQAYAGNYELYPGIIFSFSEADGQLQFSMLNSVSKNTLPQIGPRRFRLSAAPDISIEFVLDEEQQAYALDYVIGLHGRIRAKRIELKLFDKKALQLEDYAGTYFNSELDAFYRIEVEGGELITNHIRRPRGELIPYQSDTFFANSGGLQKVTFLRDEHKRIASMSVSASLANNVIFDKIE